MSNIKEFKELIEKYSSITLERIEEVWNEYDESYVHSGEIMHSLTGFGGVHSCSLCKAIGNKAYGPAWNEDPNCRCCNCVYIARVQNFYILLVLMKLMKTLITQNLHENYMRLFKQELNL